MPPRRMFEDLCAVVRENCSVTISPGVVTLAGSTRQDDVTTISSMTYDKVSGRATNKLELKWDDGRFTRLTISMRCQRTAIPVFE